MTAKKRRCKHEQNEFSMAMKKRMSELMITPAMMAQDLYVNVGCVYHWRRGDRMPKLDMAMKIADYLNISLDALCGR